VLEYACFYYILACFGGSQLGEEAKIGSSK
jgi:hypothetical protein